MGDRAGRVAAVCFVLASLPAVEVRAGSSWRGAEGVEDPIFDCDFESGICGFWSAATTPDGCDGLDDDCDTDIDEDASCSAGLSCCGSGGCVDLMTDPGQCGFCDTPCPLPDNGTASCVNGTCAIGSCDTGFDDCDGKTFNGCETDLNTDSDHCQFCGQACPLPDNGTASCTSGVCGIGSCNVGFDDCDGQSDNGCETDLDTDINHCGGCDQPCAAGETCTAGSCVAPGSAGEASSSTRGGASRSSARVAGRSARTSRGFLHSF